MTETSETTASKTVVPEFKVPDKGPVAPEHQAFVIGAQQIANVAQNQLESDKYTHGHKAYLKGRLVDLLNASNYFLGQPHDPENAKRGLTDVLTFTKVASEDNSKPEEAAAATNNALLIETATWEFGQTYNDKMAGMRKSLRDEHKEETPAVEAPRE